MAFKPKRMAKIGERRLEVRKSGIEGLGLFTKYDIRPGEIICVFQGEVIGIPELKNRYAEGKERITDPLQISERLYLDIDRPYCCANHSCSPNAGIIREATLISLRPIRGGDEITYDYSTTEWTWKRFGKNKEWEMDCKCDSPKCRRLITQFHLLPREVKMRYYHLGALQDFIIRKIIKSI